jgi:GNAT superfamily N-acetyltransferase
LVGWIDVGIVHHLQSGPFGEIGGLIVSEKYHGCGIGAALVETAEKWIASHNVHKVLVRSQIAREGAHAFYIRQNFSRTKTSAVFTKSIGPR